MVREEGLLLGEAARAIGVSQDTLRRWDRAGKITSAESWKNYVNQFAERLHSPIELTVNH